MNQSVRDGILWEKQIPGGVFVEYQPGNGLRYPMLIQVMSGPECPAGHELDGKALESIGFSASDPTVLVYDTSRGRGWIFRNSNAYLSAAYVAEKLRCSHEEGEIMSELIAHFTRRVPPSRAKALTQPPAETVRPTPCPRCEGCGAIVIRGDGHETRSPCPECGGEGVRRVSP